jgi:NADH:ubiquinone oxidoreductase subunit 6 (subunit J)
MSKRTTVGLVVTGLMLVMLIGGIVTTDFEPMYDSPQGLPTYTTNHNNEAQDIFGPDGLKENSLPYAIFEQYGFVLIPLAVLMFGAMVGGVVISKEEVEE